MPKCNCRCHDKKGFLETIIQISYQIFMIAIYFMIYSVLLGGGVAAMFMFIEKYPDYSHYMNPFIQLSSLGGQLAVAALAFLILLSLLKFIVGLFKKKTVEVHN